MMQPRNNKAIILYYTWKIKYRNQQIKIEIYSRIYKNVEAYFCIFYILKLIYVGCCVCEFWLISVITVKCPTLRKNNPANINSLLLNTRHEDLFHIPTIRL